MAYLLFKYIRGKIREGRENKLPTTDGSHLIPEPALDPKQEQDNLHPDDRTHARVQPPILNKDAGEHARAKAEASRRRIYRWKMILGLVLPNFLSAVDVTIVAPAIPTISSHFDRLNGSFNWIVAAYTLTFTTFVPASGQIADIYGRHFALQFQMFWILIGSVLCASAASWGMLLFGRALQGLGAAGILNLTRIVLSDGVSLADNSKNNTVFSLINGISYAVGPVIGGYLSSSSWRYCFVVPIPIAALSHILIFFLMRKDLKPGRVSFQPGDRRRTGYVAGLLTFDWLGIIFFIFGVGLIILALQWGGTQYSWSSAATIAPLVIGALLFLSFFAHEYLLAPGRFANRILRGQVPMIPSTLFRRKDTSLLMVINFATGTSLVSAFYFISYYWQLAEGYPSSKAGVQLLYYTPGLGVGVYSAMFLCNVWPRQTFPALFVGSIVEAVGLALLTWAVSARHTVLVSVFLAVSGAGTGLRFMPVVLHAAGVWPERIANMQSLMSFMIPFGETVGISMMGAVFGNKLSTYLGAIDLGSGNGALATSHGGVPNLDVLAQLPVETREAVQNAAARAVMWSFISILPFMGLAIVASMFLGNVWIGREASVEDGKVLREEAKGMVLRSVFLKALVLGKVAEEKEVVQKGDDVEEREKVGDAEQNSRASA